MILKNLKMYPYNTSLMGVIKGISDYFGYGFTESFLYGASGHAFLINIHEELCPSSPYCWENKFFYTLLKNLGIKVEELGFYLPKTPVEKRNRLEERIKGFLDDGVPCSMVNLEHQTVNGYDDEGIFTYQPWPNTDFPPAKLSYSTWIELGKKFHVSFFAYHKCSRADVKKTFKDSIITAVDLFESPSKYTWKGYAAGADAYDNFINAVDKGFGNTHGNWWNALVWAECRYFASQYLKETGCFYDEEIKEKIFILADKYDELSRMLEIISSKELENDKKIELLNKAKQLETENIRGLRALLDRKEI